MASQLWLGQTWYLICLVLFYICVGAFCDSILPQPTIITNVSSLNQQSILSKNHDLTNQTLFRAEPVNRTQQVASNSVVKYHKNNEPSVAGKTTFSLNKLQASALALQVSNNDCPTEVGNISLCSCYNFDDGLYIECAANLQLDSIKLTLNQSASKLIKSFTIYHLNQTGQTLSSQLFTKPVSIERLQISFSNVENLTENTFLALSDKLKSLSLINGKLKRIPQNALKSLKHLENLDLDSNQITELESYAFYGLPLTVLNLQANRISTLLEYSFGGLENTLEELTLINNCLNTFPLVALRRLRKLRTLKLVANEISELLDDGFTRFTALINLDLSSNRLTSLNERSFITMPKLLSLSLYGNRLVKLTKHPFVHLFELETLDLSHNLLRELQADVFHNLFNLRTLDLSSNHIHLLPATIFQQLSNLRELYLTRNNLLKISNQTFHNSSAIQALFLSHNAIFELEFGTFHQLSNLQQLHLSFNQIRDIHINLFKNNVDLRTLALDNNLIANLQAGCFQELVELRDLRLQKNLLKRIRKGVFYSFPNLQELHLQYNRIEVIENEALQSLINLQYLNLQNNKLIEIGESLSKFPSSLKYIQLNNNAILNIANNSLKGQGQLEVIWINQNKLQKLSADIFQDLSACEKLYLQYNELASIESGSFAQMSKLVYLNLEHNNLNQLNGDLFKGANSLVELYLSDNHIMDIEPNTFQSLTNLRWLTLDNNQIYVLRQYVFINGLSIEQISLSNTMVEEMEEDTFSSLNSLKKLDLSDNNLKRVQLNFSGLNQLLDLNLASNNLSDKRIVAQLCKLTYLNKLDISNTEFELSQLSQVLRCLTNLQTLNLDMNEIESLHKSDVISPESDNVTYSNIIELSLERNLFTTIPAIDAMAPFVNLQRLILTGNNIKQTFKNELQFNQALKMLNLSSNGLSVLDAQSFANLSQLTVLDLSFNVMRFLPVSVFQGLSSLEELHLDHNWFQFLPNNFLQSNLINLKVLTMNLNPLVRIREDLSVVGSFSSLTSLSLNDCNLTIIASHDFFGLNQLVSLSLRNNHITKISPGSFRPLSKLIWLDLAFNELEILPEERLNGLSQLRNLNLTHNQLLEMPIFNGQLNQLKDLDLSFNKILRVDTFAGLGSSLFNFNLKKNQINWIDKNAFQNFTSIKILDLSNNFITHLNDALFNPIEVTLEQLLLSGNPIHCDCRLLSLWQWLQEHSKIITSVDNDSQIFCTQPENLAYSLVLSVHPVDFCPIPLVSSLEVQKQQSTSITVQWEVQNSSLVGGFTLDYHQAETRISLVTNRLLAASERHVDISHLTPTTLYTICVQANGKYLGVLTNKPTAYVVDHHKHPGQYATSSRKCIQVRTLDHSKRVPIQISTIGLIVIASTISGVFLMCIIVLIIGIRYRKKRNTEQQPAAEIKVNEIPEEYISYRHFSLPSSENVYS